MGSIHTYRVDVKTARSRERDFAVIRERRPQSPSRGLPDIVAPDTSGGVMVLLNLTK